jgi:hypothetical protein
MSTSLRDRLVDPNYSQFATAPMVNAVPGAQMGSLIDVGKYVQNAHYVRKNVMVRVVEYPKWISYMPNPQPYREAIKSWFETQTKVDGLNKALTAEFVRTPIGPSGHQQADFAKTVEAQSVITHTAVEKYGRYFRTLFEHWLRFGMGDHLSGVPLVSIFNPEVTDALPDLYSCSVIYFEPDPLHRYVQDAFLVTNMAPESAGPDDYRKDPESSGESVELPIQFTGLQQTSYGVKLWAQELLDQTNRGGFNSIAQRSVRSAIDADVQATKGGWNDGAAEKAASVVG